MVIALGEVETQKLIDDLIIIATGKNELNEKNSLPGKFTHGDGWGFAYLEKGTWKIYKSVTPIYKDPKVRELKNIKTEAAIFHVRRATKGTVSIENTQPFIDENRSFLFTHNGTVNELANESYSDSYNWFKQLTRDSEVTSLAGFNDFDATNFFFLKYDSLVVGQNYKNYPNYYTMKYLSEGDKLIISSEILPSYKNKNWVMIKNRSTIQFSLLDFIKDGPHSIQ